ncbi:hypothetical protein SBA6_60059 [Candidatus Sulfopaludibacter sp. SbA6]|nr:hypothetical protein SBA6_60059 [Candidatus Sulfopaludibacter sp. SbA6]
MPCGQSSLLFSQFKATISVYLNGGDSSLAAPRRYY